MSTQYTRFYQGQVTGKLQSNASDISRMYNIVYTETCQSQTLSPNVGNLCELCKLNTCLFGTRKLVPQRFGLDSCLRWCWYPMIYSAKLTLSLFFKCYQLKRRRIWYIYSLSHGLLKMSTRWWQTSFLQVSSFPITDILQE